MPHWCCNVLTIYFNEQNTLTCEDKSQREMEEFIIHLEKDIEDTEEYEGTILGEDPFGNKISCCQFQYVGTQNELCVYFNSTWDPPLDWFEHMVKKYPNCLWTLWYEEPEFDRYGAIISQHNVLNYKIWPHKQRECDSECEDDCEEDHGSNDPASDFLECWIQKLNLEPWITKYNKEMDELN